MASMKPCRTCKQMVATNAILCPYCGRTSPAPGFLTKWIGRIVTVVVVVGVIVILIAIVGNN